MTLHFSIVIYRKNPKLRFFRKTFVFITFFLYLCSLECVHAHINTIYAQHPHASPGNDSRCTKNSQVATIFIASP